MILDDTFCLCWANHHRVEDLRPQNRNTSNHRNHDDQCFPGSETATGWLSSAVDRCHYDWLQVCCLLELQPMLTLAFLLAFLLPIWKMPASRSLVTVFQAKKKTFSFHLFFCFLPRCRERYRPPSVSTIFTQFFLFAHHWPRWLGYYWLFYVHSI